MLTALLFLIGALFAILFLWYLFLLFLENVGPFILSMILLPLLYPFFNSASN